MVRVRQLLCLTLSREFQPKGKAVLNRKSAILLFLVLLVAATAAQTGQWITFSHDPQRSGFAADEHAFSVANVSTLGLEWKTTVPNEPTKACPGSKASCSRAKSTSSFTAWCAGSPARRKADEGEWGRFVSLVAHRC